MERWFCMRKTGAALFGLLLCLLAVACDGSIYDDEGDCSITYRVRFRYDWNMKFADAFAHEVKSVTLYVLDEAGNIVWQRTEAGEALATEDYAMAVDVAPGTYDLMAWCGTTDKGSFRIPDAGRREELTCTLRRGHDDGGAAFVEEDLDRLYHGYLAKQTFEDREGVHTMTMRLKKNTNNVRVVLQHLSGEPVEADKFTFSISDDNGRMDWDNSLMEDEPIDYRAWHVDAGQAEIGYDGSRSASIYTTAVAELTVPRLMLENRKTARLTVRHAETGKTVLSIRLIDALLLVKGYYNREMSDQEYLDRQDEYAMTFFIDEGYRWENTCIYINSWRVVLQDIEL